MDARIFSKRINRRPFQQLQLSDVTDNDSCHTNLFFTITRAKLAYYGRPLHIWYTIRINNCQH